MALSLPETISHKHLHLLILKPVQNALRQQVTESDVAISYKSIANTDTGSGRNYRGGDTVKVVQLSTSIPFQGIGFLKSVSGGSITDT